VLILMEMSVTSHSGHVSNDAYSIDIDIG